MTWFHFDPQSFAFSFLSVLFESVPFLLLGSLVSGVDRGIRPGALDDPHAAS